MTAAQSKAWGRYLSFYEVPRPVGGSVSMSLKLIDRAAIPPRLQIAVIAGRKRILFAIVTLPNALMNGLRLENSRLADLPSSLRDVIGATMLNRIVNHIVTQADAGQALLERIMYEGAWTKGAPESCAGIAVKIDLADGPATEVILVAPPSDLLELAQILGISVIDSEMNDVEATEIEVSPQFYSFDFDYSELENLAVGDVVMLGRLDGSIKALAISEELFELIPDGNGNRILGKQK